MQQQKSRERRSEYNSTKEYTTADEPPTWSELFEQANVSEGTIKIGAISTIAAGATLLSGLPSFVPIFFVAFLSTLISIDNLAIPAIAGGLTASILAFISSILLTIVSLGLFTVIPAFIIGAIAGLAGGWIGKKIK